MAELNQQKGRVRLPFLLLPAATGLFAIGLFVWSKTRVEHLDTEARDIALAAASNNPDLLYDHAFEKEIKAEKLTRDKWRRVWDSLIQPRFAPFHAQGPVQVELDGDGSEGVAALPVADAAGHKWEIDVNLWGTDNHGRLLLSGYLMASWVFQYAISKGNTSFSDITDAKIQGFRHDRQTLESLGITQLAMLDPKSGSLRVASLDQMDAGLSKTLAVAKAGNFK